MLRVALSLAAPVMADLEPVTSISRVINVSSSSNHGSAVLSDEQTTSNASAQDKMGKRRPRRSYNCGPCKRQKIKCDTNIPCGACTRHNRVDQCLASPPNPPSPDHKKRVRKQSLSSFGDAGPILGPAALEAPRALPAGLTISQTASTTSSSGQHSAITDMRLPSLQAHTSSFKIDTMPQRMGYQKPWDPPGLSLAPSPMGSRDDEVRLLKNQVALLTDRLASLEAKLTTHGSSSMRTDTTATTMQEVIQMLPDFDTLVNMVGFFKIYLNKPLEIIDIKSIDSRLASLRNLDSSVIPNNNDWETISLISMIVSLTVLHYPFHSIETELKMTLDGVISYANSMFQVSKSALSNVRYKESPRLIHAQILLLYDLSLRLFNKKNLILAVNSELVSMAYVLGLQTLKIPQNSLELEPCQQTWWIICHNDTLNALGFGVPTLVRLDRIPKDTVGSSHILKAFISAEKTDHQSIMTHIAKLTMICNDVPTSMGSSLVEYLENLIMLDRQLTSYQIPQSFSFLNPRNDIFMNFQCCYLHFFLLLIRFRIYHRIYFSNPNNGIWFIMLSIIESFLKRYSELRRLYPPRDYLNHYLQIFEYPITVTIINLIILCTEPELLPQGLKDIIMNYTSTILDDLELFRSNVFNEKIPFYHKAFSTITKLTQHMQKQQQQQEQQTPVPEADQHIRQSELTKELKDSFVFDSIESNIGLIPSNDFFNIYFRDISHHSRNVMASAHHSWRLGGVLDDDSVEFLSCLGV